MTSYLFLFLPSSPQFALVLQFSLTGAITPDKTRGMSSSQSQPGPGLAGPNTTGRHNSVLLSAQDTNLN